MLTGKYVLHSKIYIEVEDKTCENNLVLCLMNHFKEMVYFSGSIFLGLTICYDKFVGQKKNKITICYNLWLVDTGLFSHVTLLFFIVGHKNNAYIFT